VNFFDPLALYFAAQPLDTIFMNSQPKENIIERRKEIEEELADMLDQTGSDFTVEDVKAAIYEEEGNEDMQEIIAMFDDGDPMNLSNVLELVTDAWNYFPHKALDGSSPVEKMEA
jgi:hypothetical protein